MVMISLITTTTSTTTLSTSFLYQDLKHLKNLTVLFFWKTKSPDIAITAGHDFYLAKS